MDQLKSILLVDDSLRDLELAVEALEPFNVDRPIVTLRDGAEALDYLFRRGPFAGRADGQPSVVLLDLKMPKVDGLEVLRQVKADPELKSIPIVMMTSSREESDLVRSYQLGVNAYVVKPVKFEEFADVVKQIGIFWTKLNEGPPSK